MGKKGDITDFDDAIKLTRHCWSTEMFPRPALEFTKLSKKEQLSREWWFPGSEYLVGFRGQPRYTKEYL